MSELSCYVTTFNCGRNLLDVDFFATHLFNGLKASNDVPPDVLVLNLQEIAPIAYSFMGGTFLAPYFAHYVEAISEATAKTFGSGRHDDYELVVNKHVGMVAIMVFVRRQVQSYIRDIEVAGVGVGFWEMGNKGAVGVRMHVNKDDGTDDDDDDNVASTKITFVAAHLAPGEEACNRRNLDWQCICEGLVFERMQRSESQKPSGHGDEEPLLSSKNSVNETSDTRSLFSPLSHIFFAGDLNYRAADTGPTPTEFLTWPSSTNDTTVYAELLQQDQLTRERRAGRTLHHLVEGEISFTPTYKYSPTAQKLAPQLASFEADAKGDEVHLEHKLWAKHRTPSWCDRILYLENDASLKAHSYVSLPIQPTSDHRPVALSCSLQLKPTVSLAGFEIPFTIRPGWKQARASARRLELSIGTLAYLTTTWEGEALLMGSVVGMLGGYLVLRALMGV